MRRVARSWLIVVSLLNGLAGLICGVLLLVKPDGGLLMASALLPVVATLPLASIFFRDLFWIGVAMLLALGVPNVLAALQLVRRSRWQYPASLAAAVLLMAWCGFELVYMFNSAAVGYFLVGAVSALCSLSFITRAQEASASQPLRADAAK
jgi:hypothetical protein